MSPAVSRLAFYYGEGELEALATYSRVVLQPGQYGSTELGWLRGRGVQPLAYLSLGQDEGPPAPWQRDRRDRDWDTAYVDPGHVGWIESRRAAARASLAHGFKGLFLDTIDIADLYQEARAPMLRLIHRLRLDNAGTYFLANRGFSLLPELAAHVDGVVFESFSTTWTAGRLACRVLPPPELAINGALARQLRRHAIDVYALDYVSNGFHAVFGRSRAALHGMSWCSSDRALSRPPGRAP
jgi:polysaccharide biosynthesis protein PelA